MTVVVKNFVEHASAAETETFNGNAIDVSRYATMQLLLNCTAASGTTPTLDIKIQISADGVTNWIDSGTAFTQVTAATTQNLAYTPTGAFIRLVHTIGGTTPSFTYYLAITAKA